MNDLHCNVRREVLNSTYPALYVVFFSILEGNTRETTWKEQHFKTLQITKENHARLAAKIEPLGHVRSISIKDQERFTSPWAVTETDEKKFEKTVSTVGRLLRDDRNLQALYHMLVMMTPASSASLATRVHSPLLTDGDNAHISAGPCPGQDRDGPAETDVQVPLPVRGAQLTRGEVQ